MGVYAMKLDKKELAAIKKVFYKLPDNQSLTDWLDMAMQIHPAVRVALDGFYCGHDGSIATELDEKHLICMMWHERENGRKVVECAYIS